MKKQIKILLIAILSLSLFLPVTAYADSIKLTKKTYVKTGSGSSNVTKFKTNKGYAYCITPGKSGPPVGTKLTRKKTYKSGSIVYMLDKATTSDSSFMITQIALWKYVNGYKRPASTANWNKANKLISDAKKNSKYDTTPSVSIKASGSTLTETGSYYKSGKITISVKNIKKNLSVVVSKAPKYGGIALVDSNGKVKTTFKDGDVFYVQVPRDNVTTKGTITVTISGTGSITTVGRFKSSNSKHQELIEIFTEDKTVSDSINLTVTPVVRKCQYYDGKYYGKDGKVVDKTQYSIECEKHSCEKVGDTYFGKNGSIVSYEQFKLECEKHVCEIIDGHYFGKTGSEVSKQQYSIECEKHFCEVIDGHYFGKDGLEVGQSTYDKECNKHVCEIVDDTYFGPQGTAITYEEYVKLCEKHSCEKIGDDYFGRDGNIVSFEQFTLECEKHACEIIGDKFIDAKGNIVDEATYRAQCEAPEPVIVPDTADLSGLLLMLVGTMLIGGTMVVLNTIKNNA